MPRKPESQQEQVTADVDGVPVTGWMRVKDVGLGKVMFEIDYRELHHHDTSVFSRGDPQVHVWARIELTRLAKEHQEAAKSRNLRVD